MSCPYTPLGPERGADMPRVMLLSVMPGSPWAKSGASRQRARVASRLRQCMGRFSRSVEAAILAVPEKECVPADSHGPPAGGSGSVAEEFLHLVHPGLGAGIVRVVVVQAGGLQFAQQFFLAVGQVDRRFDHDMAEQVAMSVAANPLDALAAQPEDSAGLGFGRDLDGGGTVEGGNLDLATQGSGGEGDRHLAMQVV